MTVLFIDQFESNLSCAILDELPVGSPVRYFPGGSSIGGNDGLLVQIFSPLTGAWIGMFAFGDVSRRALSGVYTCPNRSRLCVVSAGQGIYVSSDDPSISEVIPVFPIEGVYPVPSSGLLILHDHTRFVAYGIDGIEWETPSLSWDGIGSVRICDSTLKGKGWDSPSDHEIEFEISLHDGSCKGGPNFESASPGRE